MADATRKKSRARRWAWVSCLLVVGIALAWLATGPRHVDVGDRRFSISIQKLAPDDYLARQGMFIRTGWAGQFKSGDIYGIKLAKWLLRLEIVTDPIAAAQRRLPKTLAGLIQALGSKDIWLRHCAREELANRGAAAKPALPTLVAIIAQSGDSEVYSSALAVSKVVGAEAIPVVTNAMAHATAVGKEKLAEILGDLGPDAKGAIPFLKEALHDPTPRVALYSALALSKIDGQPHGAVPVLQQLLTHADTEIRAGAAATLGEFGKESAAAVPSLVRGLTDTNAQARAMSARSLGMIGPAARSAIPNLISRLDEPNGEARAWTITALGQFGESAAAAIPKLTAMAANENEPAQCAINALAEMGTNAVPGLVKLYQDARPDTGEYQPVIAKALIRLGTNASSAVPVLVEDLHSENMNRVGMAARVLGRLGPGARSAVPQLEALLTNETLHVRVNAAAAVWRLDGRTNTVLPVFQAIVSPTSTHTQWEKRLAAETLAEMLSTAPEAESLLKSMLGDPDPFVRQFASEALKKSRVAP